MLFRTQGLFKVANFQGKFLKTFKFQSALTRIRKPNRFLGFYGRKNR